MYDGTDKVLAITRSLPSIDRAWETEFCLEGLRYASYATIHDEIAIEAVAAQTLESFHCV